MSSSGPMATASAALKSPVTRTHRRDPGHRQATLLVREYPELVGEFMPGIRLSSDLCDELSKTGKSIMKRKGTVLFRVGQAGKGAFVIRSGRVRMSLGTNPRLYCSRALGPGSVIGLPATFSGEPYSLTAEAECDCHLDFIPRVKLLNLLRSNPTVGFQIVRVLSEEIFQMRKGVVALKTPRRGRREKKVASGARG